MSAVHALDGRIADLAAIRDAARAHGALTYVDITQAAGWLPLRLTDFDYTVCGAFKWLLCPRGTTFMVFGGERGEPGGPGWPVPVHAGWVAGEDPGESNYGPIDRPAATARRYDEPHAHYSYVAAEHSLGLLAELGVDTVHAHNVALAEQYRAGLEAAGFTPRAAPGSAIVSTRGWRTPNRGSLRPGAGLGPRRAAPGGVPPLQLDRGREPGAVPVGSVTGGSGPQGNTGRASTAEVMAKGSARQPS
ncbi:hypothetical protein O1L44_26695 [Streptomyces noursei]|nr:hypothetical protein [Streptomyces noursei]